MMIGITGTIITIVLSEEERKKLVKILKNKFPILKASPDAFIESNIPLIFHFDLKDFVDSFKPQNIIFLDEK
jgi:hypothetical protein